MGRLGVAFGGVGGRVGSAGGFEVGEGAYGGLEDRDAGVVPTDAAVPTDTGLGMDAEALDTGSRDADGWPMPIHQCGIVAMGLHLLDNLRLDTLAEACARHGRWEFFLVVAPLRVKRGTGSPVNPIAFF